MGCGRGSSGPDGAVAVRGVLEVRTVEVAELDVAFDDLDKDRLCRSHADIADLLPSLDFVVVDLSDADRDCRASSGVEAQDHGLFLSGEHVQLRFDRCLDGLQRLPRPLSDREPCHCVELVVTEGRVGQHGERAVHGLAHWGVVAHRIQLRDRLRLRPATLEVHRVDRSLGRGGKHEADRRDVLLHDRCHALLESARLLPPVGRQHTVDVAHFLGLGERFRVACHHVGAAGLQGGEDAGEQDLEPLGVHDRSSVSPVYSTVCLCRSESGV